MTGASIHSPDRTSVPPTDVRAAASASMSPKVGAEAAAPHSHDCTAVTTGIDAAKRLVDVGCCSRAASGPSVTRTLSSQQCDSEPALVSNPPLAPHLAGLASAGSALSFEDEVSAVEARGFAPSFVGIDTGAGDDMCVECGFGRDGRLVSVKYVSTFRVAAASEIISKSVSTTSIPTT